MSAQHSQARLRPSSQPALRPRARTAPLRGKPLAAIVGLFAVWILLRIAFWQSPLALPVNQIVQSVAQEAGLAVPKANGSAKPGDAQFGEPTPRLIVPVDPEWQAPPQPPQNLIESPLEWQVQNAPENGAPDSWPRAGPVAQNSIRPLSRPISDARTAGHLLLLAAGLSNPPMSPGLEQFIAGRGPVSPQAIEQRGLDPASDTKRWSADAWALWRANSSNGPLASDRPGYGRSQIGAVMRYSLAPSSGHKPQAYLRASSALEGGREREMAAGLSARPLSEVPVRLAGEVRVSDRANGSQARLAAFAVSELPPVELPAGLSGETYVQAGYVTGDFETAFIDGQLRITRELAETDDFRLSAGGGVWGGAQKGVARVDVGPSASVTFRLGEESFGRLSADYRFRVAGKAAPASGPALTLSAGF